MGKTSMQDIADELNISKNAVSLALNGKPGISDALKEKILEKARELDYGGLKKIKLKKKNLLLIVDDRFDREDEFFLPLISSLLRHSAEQGYRMMLTTVSEEMQKKNAVPSVYYEMDAAGVVFLGQIEKDYLEYYVKEKIPCLMMLLHHYGVKADYVLSANVDGAFLVTKHLISCGHKRIGYFADVGVYSSFVERLWGYRHALLTSGLGEQRQNELLSTSGYGFIDLSAADSFADKILHMDDPPTAWVCGNDAAAFILINALKDRGIRVPDDVSVAGFDGMKRIYMRHPVLCSYDVKRDVLAKKAVELLIKRIHTGYTGESVIESVAGELVIGESVKKMD